MDSKEKRIILMGAGFTTGNMGVWALASGAVTSVLHSNPTAKIYLFDYHYEPATYEVKHPGGSNIVELINIRFSKKFWLPNNIARLLLTALLIRLLPFKGLRDSYYSRNFWLRHIQTADFICSIAGGDSFSDIYGLRRLIYVALPQILVLLMGQNLILLPQTIGPFESAFGKTIARYILKRAQNIYSRDHEGVVKVRGLLQDDSKPVAYCYDMGFVLEPKIEQERIPSWLLTIDQNTPLVGLNVSGLLYIGGYTRNNMFGLKGDYSKMIHGLISHFIHKHKAHIMLVPHVLGDEKNRESDVAACQNIFREADTELRDHLHVVGDGFDHHELKALIGHCDFFLGSRMHACIAALSQCVPAVGLAYSPKFRGVFSTIGMEDFVIDLRKHNENTVIEMADRAFEKQKELRTQLEDKMPSVRECILSLFSRDSI